MTTDTIIPRASRRYKPLPSLEVSDELLAYDPGTGVFRWLKRIGNNAPTGSIAGTTGTRGYRIIRINRAGYMAHRLAFKMYHRREPAGEVDHRDGDTSNNRISNLREASPGENHWNLGLSPANTSGVKGVRWHKKKERWVGQIRVNGKRYYLGPFKTLQAAEIAVRAAREHHHGEFTCHE